MTRTVHWLSSSHAAPSNRAFSLVEMLVVITIIGIVTLIALPSIGNMKDTAEVRATAADFRNFQTAFLSYSAVEREYPPDMHNQFPPAMEGYLTDTAFEKEAAISGRYNWEGPDYYDYAGISLTSTEATIEQLTELDDILDDGNLNTGSFRRTPNGRYTFIIEDGI